MVFCDLINKSDNAREHNYELNKLGKCHSLSPPFRENRLPLCSTHELSIPQIPIFVNFSKYIFKNILKHFREIFRLFISRKPLLCEKSAPFVANPVFMPSEAFKPLLIVFLTDEHGLTEGRIFHKTAHKQYPFAVVHLVLFRGQFAVLLCDGLSDQVFIVFKIIPLLRLERTAFRLFYVLQNPPVLLPSWRL